MNQLLKLAGTGILALGLSLTASAEMTKEEVIAKIEAGMSKAQRTESRDWNAAVDALLKAGVAPEASASLIQEALSHEMPAGEIVKQAREIGTLAKGDREAATGYANDLAAYVDKHEGQWSAQMREDIASPIKGDHDMHNATGMGGGYGAGFGGDMTGAATTGAGATTGGY